MLRTFMFEAIMNFYDFVMKMINIFRLAIRLHPSRSKIISSINEWENDVYPENKCMKITFHRHKIGCGRQEILIFRLKKVLNKIYASFSTFFTGRIDWFSNRFIVSCMKDEHVAGWMFKINLIPQSEHVWKRDESKNWSVKHLSCPKSRLSDF